MPGRPKGLSKTGGRKAGTPNKNALGIERILEEQEFDVMAELISLCRSSNNEMIRAKILVHISEFIFPKRKAVELSTNEESGFRVTICDYTSKNTQQA